jgi:multidrug efflux pump subunit AcrA (membrane-fusion protein)
MTKNLKRIVLCLAIAIILTLLILQIPNWMKKSLPTVSPVKIAKVEVKDTVTVDGEIFIDEGNGNYIVKTYIPEKDISRVKIGQNGSVTGTAFPDSIYEAQVIGIAEDASKIIIGNATKTVVEVWSQILYPDKMLKHGYTATIEIITGDPERKRLIPYEAVNQDEGGTFIFVLKGSTAVKRYIKTGEDLPDGIEVLTGLDENEEVINLPEGVSDGDEVVMENTDSGEKTNNSEKSTAEDVYD